MLEPVTVRALLRQATHDAHRRVDALFADGLADARTYRAYLEGMRAFLARAGALPGVDEAIARIEQDLAAVGAPLPPRPAAAPRTQAAGLGWRYVIDGSSLGARVLLRQAVALGHGPAHGARFLAAHASGDRWRETLRDLDASPADPGRHRELRDGAVAAFEAAHDALHGALAIPRSATPA